MLRGASRYTLTSSEGKRSIQLRSSSGYSTSNVSNAAPLSITGTTGFQKTSGSNKANVERYRRDLLDGFIDYNTISQIRPILNDIYFSDPVCGSIIDIRSNLPFSNFELSGCESKERRDKFVASINAMQIRSMFPMISRERMVEGKHVSFMNFDDSKKHFTSIIPYSPEFLNITPIPIFGRDPLIDVKYPSHIINAVKSTDEDMRAELDNYAEDLVEMVNNNKTRLNPKFVLYVARQPFTWSPYGISILRRIIPLWLLEKNLMRGTIDMSGRRQKALRQIVAGDDSWLPTNEQLEQITNLLINADNDPLGAVIATRPGIEIQEVGGTGADGWDAVSQFDTFTTMKFRALGVSDLIFGDFNVQAAEQTINATLEDLISEREDLTHRVLYNKMFLTIASENDFRKKSIVMTGSMSPLDVYNLKSSRITKQSEYITLAGSEEALNPAEFDLPTVRWEKSLKIVSNDALFNNLGTLAERGMPAPIRLQAAVLGVSAEEMFAALPQDIEDRKLIADYQAKLPQPPQQNQTDAGNSGGGDNSMFMESSDLSRIVGSNPFAKTKNRSFEAMELRDVSTGKILSSKGRKYKDNRDNKVMLEAAKRIRENTRPEVHNRLKTYSYKKRSK